jgi:hypothetical protein
MIRGINVIGSPSCIFYESNDLRFDNNLIWLMDCDFYVSLYKKYGPPALIDDICIKNRIWDGNVSNKIATEAIRKREEVYVAKKHDRKYRVCVLTALAGSRDMVIDPGVVHPGVEYHAFVDRAWPCRVWKQHPLEQFTEDSRYAGRRNAKIYKIMPHLFLPDHDFSIWVDPTHEVVHDTDKLCDMLGEADIGVFEHRERHCAYDEADEILRLRYDDPGNVHALKSFFVEKGFPRGYGLYEIPVMVRRNNAATQRMALKWWEMICRYSSRDQISFSYIRWKLGIVSQVLPGYANGINPATGTVGYNDLIPQVRRHGSVGGSFFQNNLDRVHQV